MRILLIGKNSIVAKSFAEKYSNVYNITSIGRNDSIEQFIGKEHCYDSVVFLAQSQNYKSGYFTEDLFNVNINLLYKSLQLLRDRSKQFIYFSSGSVYQNNNSGIYTESSELNIKTPTPYIASKISGEIIVNAAQQYFYSTVILRPFYIYGKGQKPHMLLTSLYNKLINNEEIILNSNGGLIFNPVHSEDVAGLLQNLIENQDINYSVFNVAGSETITLKDVINYMAHQLGYSPRIQENSVHASTCIGKVSTFGWTPTVSIKDGISKTFNPHGK